MTPNFKCGYCDLVFSPGVMWESHLEQCAHYLKGELGKARLERDGARELAAMYLQCMNSRALERGETVEQVAVFCEQEFAENPWLKEEYEKLVKVEAAISSFCREARFDE